jgi:hypothetical protein
MTTRIPAHFVEAIRDRIALLREAWNLDDGHSGGQPRLRGYPLVNEQATRAQQLGGSA